MNINSINKEEFYKYFESINIYNSKAFIDLNSCKVSEVKYLLFKERKVKAGIILGINDNFCFSHFSAPYGGFIFSNQKISLQSIYNITNCLDSWFVGKKYKGIKITPPPLFYDQSLISELSNCFNRLKYSLSIDLNYHFELKFMNDNYLSVIYPNARKNLKKGFRNSLKFKKVSKQASFQKVYSILKLNREQRGLSLKLSFKEIMDHTKIITTDFFMILLESKIIASAICFRLNSDKVQVIYWGHDTDFNTYAPMNYLSYNIFRYYKNLNFKIVDIGPSTKNGLPNYGLCRFKRSIGCSVSNKFQFQKTKN